jgi:methionyl-tRNA formyltransferase
MVSVAFLGSHGLGVDCLDRLHDHREVDVEVVVTYPPDESHWWDGSVYDRAVELGYDILTIDEERELLEYPVEYLLSVYYPNILDDTLLEHPSKGALNLHQAELPRYRGSNVFTHSILNARADDYWRHGTTLHFMVEAVDEGPVVDRRFIDITEADTARSLYEKTREASVELFEDRLPAIVSGDVHELATPQSEFDGPRYFYSKASLDGRKEIPPERLTDPDQATAVYDLVRALDFPPFEPAYTTLGGNRVYLTKAGYERFRRE